MIHPDAAEPSPVAIRSNPFKGLAYYESSDKDRFAGRQRDIEAVVNGILRTRTFVVYGRSGLGKTSLLLAGVFPRLQAHGCRTLDLRLLEDPLDDLRRALGQQCGLKEGEFVATDLADLIRRFGHMPEGEDRLVVIAFDQFEEFFVRFADQPDPAGGVRSGEELDRKVRQKRIAQREEFIREIGQLAADARLNFRLVFSLREDWIAQMGDFADAIPEILQHMHRLLPLTSFGVRQTIVETLRSGNVDFDSRLISAVVDTLADVHFDPVVLQVLCSEIWERATKRCTTGPLRLELDDLKTIGGVRDVFRGYLNQVLQEIGPEEPPQRRKVLTGAVLDALISEKRTKLAMPKEELLRQHFQIEELELDEVLDRLYRHRLVRVDPRGGVAWYELVHERLVGAILEWFETDHDFFDFRSARILVVNSCRNRGWRENPDLLLHAGQIDGTVGRFKEMLRFTDEEKLFLVSSAVYGPSKDLEYWADLAGLDTSMQLLDRYFDQEDFEDLRMRAAEAARRVKERRDHFSRRCLDLALHDPNEKVRQAAALSFADLASEQELKLLAERLQASKDRPPALAVLVEVIDKGKLGAKARFGRRNVWRAQRRLYHRRLNNSRKEIRARAKRGAVVGLAAALLWGLTAVLPLARIASFEFFPEETLASPKVWLLWAGIYVAVAVGLGALVGGGIAWRSARVALRRKREGLFFRSLAGGILPLVCGVVALAWALWSGWAVSQGKRVSNAMENPIWLAGSGLVALTLLFLRVWLAFLTAIAKPALWPFRKRREAWLWAWLWSLGGSLLPFLFVWPHLEAINRVVSNVDDEGTMSALFSFLAILGPLFGVMVVAVLGGLIAYTATLSLVLSLPGGGPPRDLSRSALVRRRISQSLGVLLAVGACALVFQSFGWDGLPFLADRYSLGQGEIIKIPAPVAHGPINTLYVNLDVPADRLAPEPMAPRLAEVSWPPGWKGGLMGRGRLSSGSVLVVRPGEHRRMAFWGGEKPDIILIRPDQDFYPGLLVLPVARRNGVWSARVGGLADDRRGKRPLFFSPVAQGGSWCDDASLSVRIAEASGSRVSRMGFLCGARPEEVSFLPYLRWDQSWVGLDWSLTAWNSKSFPSRDAVRLSPDGALVATFVQADQDLRPPRFESRYPDDDNLYMVHLWSVDRPDRPRNIQLSGLISRVGFSQDGKWMKVTTIGGVTRLWRTDAESAPITLGTETTSDELFSPDGRRIAVLEIGGTVRVWSLSSGAVVEHTIGSEVISMAFSPDGARLATGDQAGGLQIWDLNQGGRQLGAYRPATGGQTAQTEELGEFPSFDSEGFSSLLFSPDGRWLVTQSLDGSVGLWKTDHLREVLRIGNDLEEVGRIAFSHDSARLLAALFSEVLIWKVGEPLDPIALPHAGKVLDATFSPVGDRVVTASEDGVVRIWNADGSGVPVEIVHRAPVRQLRFSGNGRRIVTASDDTAYVWNADGSGEPIILRVEGRLREVAINRDGTKVTTIPENGPIRAWDLSRPIDLSNAGPVYFFLGSGDHLAAQAE